MTQEETQNGRYYTNIIIGAGVDYLTVTTSQRDKRIALHRIAQDLSEGFVEEGSEVIKEFRFKGYRGFACGPIKWGSRSDTDIMMVAGDLADDVRHDELIKPHRVRRLDLQVTTQLAEPEPEHIQKAWSDLQSLDQSGKISVSNTLLQNDKGGATMYLGSRTSDRMGRLYDKGVQSEIASPGSILRYEIELKRDIAQGYWDALRSESWDKQVVIAWVYDYFSRRGVTPVFVGGARLVSIEYNVRNSSIDRTLIWLAEQVRASVRKVLLAGRGADLADALQISYIDVGTGEIHEPNV